MPRRRNVSRQTQTVLAALLAAPASGRHGYELSKLTSLKSGTLYPLLMRLSDQGFLESGWEAAPQSGRPPRHVYRLTAQGVALATEQATARRADQPADAPVGSPA